MLSKQIAVVTGANRGIGFEICRQLAKKDIHIILTSRNKTKGLVACQRLKEEGLDIAFHQLDVTDISSIQTLSDFLKKEYGRLDVLVNNAGVVLDKNDSENASAFKASLETVRKTMDINVYGPLMLCQVLIPFMKKNNYGRIVNISSGMGQLSEMNGSYIGYRLSKVSLNALTKIFSEELKDYNILVNTMCPGWVKTDMGGPNATKTPEEGAETAVYLATLNNSSMSGKFFRNKEIIAW